MRKSTTILLASAILLLVTVPARSNAENPTPYQGTVVTKTSHGYQALVDRLIGAVRANKMGVVARASATIGAKSLGLTIAGNQVVMVYHPKFAVRMLKASVAAGIEAPIRFYITENDDGTATLTYRKPSSVFAPYENAELDAMAVELDVIFERIAADAIGDP